MLQNLDSFEFLEAPVDLFMKLIQNTLSESKIDLFVTGFK
jgi:hypothetical protein